MRRTLLLSALAPVVAAVSFGPGSPAPAHAVTPPRLSQTGMYIEHEPAGDNSPGAYGTAPQDFAGAAVGDVDGDGHNDVAAAFPDGRVVVLNGSLGVLNGAWPRSAGAGPAHASPTLADLNGNGHLQVIETSESGNVQVWNADGSNQPGWPQTSHPLASNFPKGFFGGVAVGDLFGNGGKELVAGSWDHTLYAWGPGGNILSNFPKNLYDTIWDTPALADLEHIGQMDIVIGSDSSGGSTEPYPAGGVLWSFRPNGSRLPFTQTFNQVPWSSPAVADLAGNRTNTVIEGSGLFYNDPAGHYVNSWNVESGAHWTGGTGGRNFASPAVGHLQGAAGAQDVVETSLDGSVSVWDASGNLLWSRNPGKGGIFGSPIIAPVDGSGNNGVWIGVGQELIAYDANGNVVSDTQLTGSTWSTPTVASLDGSTLSVITTAQGSNVNPQSETTWTVQSFAIPGTTASMLDPKGKLQWPTFHYDMQRDGNSLGKIGPPPPPTPGVPGYWMVASDGGIFTFGVPFYGSEGGAPLNRPVVGMARTQDGGGYWMVASDGGIFPFGDAGGYGSHGGSPLNQPIVGMAPTKDGGGYWLVASDGGIFPYGDAGGYGSHGGSPLNKPIVGMAPTPDGGGYWLVASDGGIFPYGDAGGYGSHGGSPLNQPIVGMAATSTGHGYWLVAADGGIFPYGDATGYGSTGGQHLNKPIVGMAATANGGGYWLVASDGGIFPFGNAPGLGSTGNIRLVQPIVAMAGWS